MSTYLVQSTDLALFMNLFCKTSKAKIAEQSRDTYISFPDYYKKSKNE